jgi:hypothetical protein
MCHPELVLLRAREGPYVKSASGMPSSGQIRMTETATVARSTPQLIQSHRTIPPVRA